MEQEKFKEFVKMMKLMRSGAGNFSADRFVTFVELTPDQKNLLEEEFMPKKKPVEFHSYFENDYF